MRSSTCKHGLFGIDFDRNLLEFDRIAVMSIDASQGMKYDFVVIPIYRVDGPKGLGFVADANQQTITRSNPRCGEVAVGYVEMRQTGGKGNRVFEV